MTSKISAKKINFSELPNSDLFVDALYTGGNKGNVSDDPISKLMHVGNQGGFRYSGSLLNNNIKLVVLYSSLDELDWPDTLDIESGILYYYGDNRSPGYELHKTKKGGNVLLKNIFDFLHKKGGRRFIPPIFVFTKTGHGRDVIFRGLAVPGAKGISQTQDLVAIWKSDHRKRFQNYRAIFTILNTPHIKRIWINDILAGNSMSLNCPAVWRRWITKGTVSPLYAEKLKKFRTKKEQLPTIKKDKKLLSAIIDYFKNNPFGFENLASEILKIMDGNIVDIRVTRPYRDGGRDAVGKYKIGTQNNKIYIDFAMEAKCYGLDNGVGVKETSRLISRLRHRQLGFLVTTSYVAQQAYKEIIEDGHPIVIVAGDDIIEILKNVGIGTVKELNYFINETK